MDPDPSTTRRRFLGGVLAASVAPRVIPGRALGADETAARKIRLGHIGTGGQGTGLLSNFLGVPNAISVAIADPFKAHRERAAAIVKSRQGHEPKLYHDFTDLLADDTIDAVVIATPDHWHVPVGLAAVRAGKDVYLEKPLGYTLAQNHSMLEACKQTKRIFQYGTQQRSQEILKRGIELVLNGYIGELERIEVWAPAGKGGGSLEEIPVPDGLDYDLYIGPAPMKPCSSDRITSPGSWYCSDYALGFIAGWGAHPLDIAIWGMDHDKKGPIKFKGTGKFDTPDALFNTLTTWDVNIEFSSGVPMRLMSHDIADPIVKKYRANDGGDGTTFYGTKGWVSLSRGGVAASNMDWFRLKECEGDKRVLYRKNYYQAFVESVRDRSPSVAPIEDAVRSDAFSHLSVMAVKSGEEVIWDPEAYKIVSPAALNEKMTYESRGPWKQS